MPDVITIRGAFRYATRNVLEDALWAVRLLLDARPAPLRFRCWVTARNTLSIDLTVLMFAEHAVAPEVCETLGETAITARCVVRAKPRFAEGTGSQRALSSAHGEIEGAPPPDLDRVLEELTSSSS